MADETTQVAEPEAPAAPVPPARLRLIYEQEIRPRLQEEFGYRSPMEHPRLEKITLSMGVGDAKTNSKALDDAMEQLAVIAGQRPHITRARKSIAQFKLREGMAIGCKVTLRGNRMWEFLDRLTSVALPGSATSAASTPTASTAGATTTSACASRRSSPRSTTTASTSRAGST